MFSFFKKIYNTHFANRNINKPLLDTTRNNNYHKQFTVARSK
jgi:hypothetical protein